MTNDASTTTEAAAVAEQGVHTAPDQATSTKKASAKRNAAKGQKGAKAAKPAATKKTASKPAAKKEAKPASKTAPKPKNATPREGSKKEIVLGLLRRKEGASLAEIMDATDWQKHSVRGFISGAISKKMGLKVESSKNDAGVRIYRIK